MRTWCWLPWETITLTLALPHDGSSTIFQVKRCPQRQMIAHNVAHVPVSICAFQR